MSMCIVAKVAVCCMRVCLHSCVSPHACNCVSDLYGYIYMCGKDRHVNVVQTAAFITVCNFGAFQAYYYICFLPGLDRGELFFSEAPMRRTHEVQTPMRSTHEAL